MFVACSTLCFAREPLETALRQIAELEFDKFELALVEGGGHLSPSEAGDNPDLAVHKLRRGPSLVPSSIHLDFGPIDWTSPRSRARFDGLCKLAKLLSVAVITIPASPLGTPWDDELKRLSPLLDRAVREGLVLSLQTHSQTLTSTPKAAAELCRALPGLGLTLDPSHFILGGDPNIDFNAVYPYVQNAQLRDTGLTPAEFQVKVGQGKIEYAQIVTQLERHGYNRALCVSIIDRVDNPFDREVEIRKLKLLLETLI